MGWDGLGPKARPMQGPNTYIYLPEMDGCCLRLFVQINDLRQAGPEVNDDWLTDVIHRSFVKRIVASICVSLIP